MKRRLKESKIYTDKQKYNSLTVRLRALKSDICYAELGKAELDEFKQKLEEIITRIEERLKKMNS